MKKKLKNHLVNQIETRFQNDKKTVASKKTSKEQFPEWTSIKICVYDYGHAFNLLTFYKL